MNTNCLRCKRTLVWGEIYHDGYTDDGVLCHACKKARNEELNAELDPWDACDCGECPTCSERDGIFREREAARVIAALSWEWERMIVLFGFTQEELNASAN